MKLSKLVFFQLRLISKIKSFLSRKDLEKVIHAFIFSRLDYCNSLVLWCSIQKFGQTTAGPKCGCKTFDRYSEK